MKDCTMHRHPRKWRQRGKWVTASVPSDSDASIVANRPWKPAKSRDIPLFRSSLLSLLIRKQKSSLEISSHRRTLPRFLLFRLGVLIASCTANSNFVSEFSETLRTPLPRPLAVVR